jgi:site-specific recombinase XerD
VPKKRESLNPSFEKIKEEPAVSSLQKRRSDLRTALKRAGIKKKVRPYDIRHMYGTYMAKNGADIFAIQCLMGHSSITTTKRYLHHAEQLKQDAVRRLPRVVLDSQE